MYGSSAVVSADPCRESSAVKGPFDVDLRPAEGRLKRYSLTTVRSLYGQARLGELALVKVCALYADKKQASASKEC